MGTGVGEAMLIGAAVGGGSSALMGGDPIKGAMLGAAGGGLGAGLGAAAGGASGSLGSAGAASSFGTGLSSAGAGTGATFGTLGAGTGAVGGTAGGTLGGTAGGTLGAGSSVLAAGANPSLYGSGISALSSAAPTVGSGIGAGSSVVSPSTMSLANAVGPGNFTGFAPTLSNTKLGLIAGGGALSGMMDAERNKFGVPGQKDYVSSFDPTKFERSTPTYAPEGVYRPEYKTYAAEGGIMRLAVGGSVDDEMGGDYSAMGMDQGNMQKGLFGLGYANGGQINLQGTVNLDQNSMDPSNTMVLPQPTVSPGGLSNQISPGGPGGIGAPQLAVMPRTMASGGIAEILEDAKAQGLTPEAYQNIYGRGNRIAAMQKTLKEGQMVDGMARGGISSLGGYSDGGRMLKGPGDGMSDSIPASIANKQPARLADGEFVIPADVVSHLGNGSTDAGAKQLYAMMDKVRKARTGKKKQAPAVKANRYMPA
jgi:hypothetical protein